MIWRYIITGEEDIPDKKIIYCQTGGYSRSTFAQMVNKLGYEFFVIDGSLFRIKKDNDKIHIFESVMGIDLEAESLAG